MTEHSSFDSGSQPGDADRLDSTPWGRRFQDLKNSADDAASFESRLSFDGPLSFGGPGSTDDASLIEDADSFHDAVVEATFDEETLPTHGEIIELIETLHAGKSSPFLHRPTTNRPHSIQLPEHYEAGYAYPLVVWFHGDGASESEVSTILPKISERNYIGLALRGNVACGQGFGWSTAGNELRTLTDDVESLVLMLRRQYHIHSERVYLAGFGTGASAAIELILQKPQWFGGAACLCGSFSELQIPGRRVQDLQNKRVLLATSANSRSSKVGDLVAAGRVLYSSGMQIGTRVYQDAGSVPSRKMLSDINHWLMDDVCSTIS